MRLNRRQLDPGSRRMMAAGILCIFSGLLLALLEARLHAAPVAIFHGLPFLLIGLAAVLLLRSARGTGAAATRPERNSNARD